MPLNRLLISALSVLLSVRTDAFVPQTSIVGRKNLIRVRLTPDDEAKNLLEKAAQIRKELAALEGKTYEEVEQEAENEKEVRKQRLKEMKESSKKAPRSEGERKAQRAQMLYVPETVEEQNNQASLAIERAFKDGITRQTVRLALVKKGKPISGEEEEWPGGSKEMYREAGRPLTEELLKEVRAVAAGLVTDEEKKSGKKFFPPKIIAQDLWDFDGTALISAEAAAGPSGDVQALVFPNTDVKYLKDISQISENLGKDRLFVLMNPFWRNVESWGFNILAPNAKKLAQENVFDCEGGGFQETYVLSRFSARGEDCVALKAYPYDWQLFVYLEEESYGGIVQTAIRLGSSENMPTSAMFTELLNEREEFKLNKTMRQMNRMRR